MDNIQETENKKESATTTECREDSTYNHIVKYTGFLGIIQVLTMLVNVVRNKLAAVLLGTSGVGLSSLYLNFIGFLHHTSNLGISFSSIKEIADIEKGRRNPSYLIMKTLAKVLHFSLDSLIRPELTPDEAGQNEMKLLYLNCPPEMRETLLSHTRGFAEELKEISKKLEKE